MKTRTRHRQLVRRLIATATAVGAAAAMPAFAQTAAPASPASAASAAGPAGNAAAPEVVDAQPKPAEKADAAKAPTALNRITVTAQKRVEFLQDVPISISTLNQQQLQDAGVHNIKDLTNLVPDLSVTSTDSEANTTARIRGIGTTGDNAGLESSVGIVIDGVPRPRNGVGFGDLGEIRQIEVLKGPQGTVFGKNTSAGVISITTKRPTFNEEGSGELTVGNYGTVGVAASYNNAINDKAAFRVYFADRHHGGYNQVFTNNGPRQEGHDGNQDFYSFRGQLLLLPSDNVNVNLIGDYTERNENCCVAVTLHRDPGVGQLLDIFAGGAGKGVIPVADPTSRLAYANDSTRQRIKDGGVSAQVNWTTPYLDSAQVTSITALRRWTLQSASDLDFSGANLAIHDFSPDNGQRFNTFSQELRLSSTSGPVDWLGGLYFDSVRLQRAEAIGLQPQYESYLSTALISGIAAAFPAGLVNTANPQNFLSEAAGNVPPGTAYTGVAQRDVWKQNSTSTALFTNATWHVTEALALTGGLRYTHEKKDTDFNYANPNGGTSCARAISSNSVAAALIARGVPAAAIPAVAPIVIGNMCLPWENPLFNGLNTSDSFSENKLSGTLKAAYRWNEQLLTYVSAARGDKAGGFNLARAQSSTGQTGGASGIRPVTNTQFPGESVDSYELGAKTTLAGGNLLLNSALFYSKYKDYQLNTFSGISWVVDSIPVLITKGVSADVLWQTPITGFTLQGAATYTHAQYGSDALADPVLATLPGSMAGFAPRWTLAAGAAYQWNLTDRLMSRFNVGAKTTTRYNTGTLPNVLTEQPSFTLFDARLALGAIDKNWSVELWSTNLTNRTYIQGAFTPALQTGSINGFLGAPRTFGLTLRKTL